MNENELRASLDLLAELRTEFETQDIAKNLAVQEAVPPEIAELIDDINENFRDSTADLKAKISVLESEIKAGVVQHGGTVNGYWLNGLWVKGRVSWDEKHLLEIAIETPEILEARKVGNPHCRIVKAARK